jgi:lauroyl/myristoyl acyltransferase
VKVDIARLYALGWKVAGKVPGPVLRGAFNVVADLTWLRRTGGVVQLEKNLGRVRPDLDARSLRRLTRAGMRSYMRYFGEAFSLATMSREVVDARVRGVNLQNVLPHAQNGQAVILALGHVGNWDIAGAWATRAVAPVTTVAERLEPPELFEQFVAFRESIGLTIFPLTGSGDVFRGLVRACRNGPGLIPLLADRDLSATGVEADLFGLRARFAAGPAALAVSTGAPLVTTVVYYERLTGARRKAARSPWGTVIDFMAPIEVPDGIPRAEQVRVVTQAWVDQLGIALRAHPQDWHMLQKVFVEDLDPERYAATLARTT